VVALVLLLLYFEGGLGGHKVLPGHVPLASEDASAGREVRVESREVDDWVEWPATVTSRARASLAPKVMARVLEVRVMAGDRVRKGDLLAVLDDRDLRARVQQVEAAARAAQAQANEAVAEQRRTRQLFQQQAATHQDLERVESRATAAQAQAGQARDAVAEAQVMLGESLLRAPFDGVVASRHGDPGDLALPGRPLLVVHDPTALRLEANVAEHCRKDLQVGQVLATSLLWESNPVEARVEAIAPEADAQTRTYLIKLRLEAGVDLHPGMFATLRLPCGSHRALLVPAVAIRRSGQLESVSVRTADGEFRMRTVRTGKSHGDLVEVHAGLHEGDILRIEP